MALTTVLSAARHYNVTMASRSFLLSRTSKTVWFTIRTGESPTTLAEQRNKAPCCLAQVSA